jgi:hypothetical protein
MNLVMTWNWGGFAERIFPLHDVDGTRSAGFGDENGGSPEQRASRPGKKLLGPATDPDQYLAGAGFAAGAGHEHANPTDHGFVASHSLPLLKCERRIDSLAMAGRKATFR